MDELHQTCPAVATSEPTVSFGVTSSWPPSLGRFCGPRARGPPVGKGRRPGSPSAPGTEPRDGARHGIGDLSRRRRRPGALRTLGRVEPRAGRPPPHPRRRRRGGCRDAGECGHRSGARRSRVEADPGPVGRDRRQRLSLYAAAAGSPRSDRRWAAPTVEALAGVGVPTAVVEEAIAACRAGLSEQANRILDLASVIGENFELERARGTGKPRRGRTPGTRWTRHRESGLVFELPGAVGRYRFAHALTRDAILAAMGSTRRARLEERVKRGHGTATWPAPRSARADAGVPGRRRPADTRPDPLTSPLPAALSFDARGRPGRVCNRLAPF